MFLPRGRQVCVVCSISVLRIRRITLTANIRNRHARAIENIQSALPYELTYNNEEYVCFRCWMRARRGSILQHNAEGEGLPIIHQPEVEQEQPVAPERNVVPNEAQHQPGEVVQPELVPDQNQPLLDQEQPEVEEPRQPIEQNVLVNNNAVFNLNGFSRGPNSGNSCLFHGCQSTSRHRIAETVKMKMIMEYNYYIPLNARVCSDHLQTDSWQMLLEAPNRRFEFNPQYMLDIIRLLKNHNKHLLDFEAIEEFDEAELHYWTGRTRDEFIRILEMTPSFSRRTRKPKTVLGIFLSKIRTGETDDRLASIFHMTRQNLEKKLNLARQCLTEDFVPLHLGFNHISREQAARRNLLLPNTLFGRPDYSKAIVICDATYIYVQKSTNFAFQKDTYSPHKYRNLLKPFMIVTCDGYILEVEGPYSANKNDATILRELLEREGGVIPWYLNSGDVFILDRGFRDVVSELETYGFIGVIPESNSGRASQLTTVQANKSRLCTICRWPVEVVNGRFKRDYRLFRQTYFNKSMLHMFEDFRIAAALINAFHIPLVDNRHAEEFLEIIRNRVHVPNRLADYVDENNLNRQRTVFFNITGDLPNLPQFPVLSEDELMLYSVGTYQLKLAASYYSEHVRGGEYIIEICADTQLRGLDEFQLPFENVWLLRARIKSRHSNSRKYFCYILIDGNSQGRNCISNYCCSCLTGRRTIGVCAHTMTIVWFLAWARHQDIIHRPALYLDSVIVDND